MSRPAALALPTRLRMALAILSLLLAGHVGAAWGHPGAHDRIASLSRALEQKPSPQLLLKRSLLYLEQRDYRAAMRDARRAEKLAIGSASLAHWLPQARWLAARIAFSAGRYREVLRRLDQLDGQLDGQLGNAQSGARLLLRSRALFQLGRSRAAAAAMNRALDALEARSSLSPDVYLEAARLYESVGDAHRATAALDRGLRQHPDSVPLRVAALHLARRAHDLPAALARFRALPDQLRASPLYRLEEVDLLVEMRRFDQARRALDELLVMLGQLPDARRQAPATRAIERRARRHLALLYSGKQGAAGVK